MKGNASTLHSSSIKIPRSSNVSSSVVWAPSEMSSGVTSPPFGVSTSETQFSSQTSNVLHHSAAHQPQLLRHPFHQQAYTIIDHQHHASQSQGIPISQSTLNSSYNSQSRNTVSYSQGKRIRVKH